MEQDALVFSNEKDSSIIVWKALGERWYAAAVSKATTDRVGELVTKTGMDFAISTAKRHDYHSGLYIEHAVPWTRIGRSVREMRIGKIWIEIGKFYKNPLANLAYKALQKAKEGAIRLSVGFLTPVKQRKMGIYTKLLKFDTSLVLKPAHPDTYILVGGNKMSDLMQRVMKLLGPENEQEEEKAMEMLKELFAGSKSMDGGITAVGKAGKKDDDDKKKGGGFPAFLKKTKAEDKELYGMLEKMAEASPDDEGIKKACAKMKARMAAYPEMEEEKKQVPPAEEEEEEKIAAKTKSGESVQTLLTAVAEIVDARLAPVTEALAGLSKASGQVEGLIERVKNLEANDQAAEVIAALVKRLPETSFVQASRPSDEADKVGDSETASLIEELQKRLDFSDNAPQHPLSHFVGGGGE